MHITSQKAEFSVAYLHAIASVAGYVFMGPPYVDHDSVDVELGARKTEGAKRKAPRLEIQAKCTETDDGAGDFISYPLPIKNYNDLRIPDLHVPHILVVLCVPKDLSEWLTETSTETILRRVAYWTSLRGYPEVQNSDNKTVHLPRAKRFTVAALKDIMARIGERRFP